MIGKTMQIKKLPLVTATIAYWVLLNTCRSVVVSAGLLRIFGREVAELPLVATSKEFQGKVSI